MNKPYRFYIFYFLLAILSYWQVGLFQNSLQWDMVDAHFPWRYFVSESIINGEFPFWNPYQNFGYPIHADMRSVWMPEIWLVSLFGGYSIYTFSALFICYTTIAGVAMMHLSNYFLKDDKSAFFTGVIYMLSGYLTAHAQELYTINSFAFIPLVLYQYLKLKDDMRLPRAAYFVFFVFVLLTSGYQAHSFILFYLLIFLFIYFLVQSIGQKNYHFLKKYLLYHLGLIVTLGLLLLPILVSAMQVFPYVTRLNSGVGLETLSSFSFSPQSLLSLMLPFACIRDIAFFETDISMTNIYFGIVALVFALVSIVKIRKSKIFYLILSFGFISLLASFGTDAPVRRFLYDYVPFMNMFRGSAYFRLFVLIPLTIASGYLIDNIQKNRKELLCGGGIVLTVLLAFVSYAFTHINFSQFTFFSSQESFSQILQKESSFYENVFLQGVLQMVLLSVFIYLIIIKKDTFRNVMILVVIDVFLAIQLNIYATTVSLYRPSEVHQFVSSNPKAFPIPEKLKVKECTDAKSSFGPLWKNTNIFTKRISGDSFNSFILDNTSYFKDSLSSFREKITDNYLFYFSGNLQAVSKINIDDSQSSSLFVADSLIETYSNFKNVNVLGNTYKIESFSPNKITVNVSVKTASFFNLLQAYYPGWKVYVDNKQVDIITVNTLFMAVPLTEGKHTVVFEYTNDMLLYVFLFSALLFIFIVVYILLLKYRALSICKKWCFVLFVLALMALSVYQQYAYHSELYIWKDEIKKLINNNDKSVFVVDKDADLNIKNQYISFDYSHPINYALIDKIVQANDSDTIFMAWENTFVSNNMINYLSLFYGAKEVLLDKGHSQIWILYGKSKSLEDFYQMDYQNKNWHINSGLIEKDTLGNDFLMFNSQEYGCTFSKKLTLDDIGKTVFAYVNWDIDSNDNSPLLVIDINNGIKNTHWSSVRAEKLDASMQCYQNKVLHSVIISQEMINQESVLKVIIWNKDKSHFKVDDFVVGIH